MKEILEEYVKLSGRRWTQVLIDKLGLDNDFFKDHENLADGDFVSYFMLCEFKKINEKLKELSNEC